MSDFYEIESIISSKEVDNIKIVEGNDDGTVKVLMQTDDSYVLYPSVTLHFRIGQDEDGIYAKSVTKEYWDSFGKDLPEDEQRR